MHYGHATNLIFCGGPERHDFDYHVTFFIYYYLPCLAILLKIVQQSLCVLQFEKMAEYLSSTTQFADIRSMKKLKI